MSDTVPESNSIILRSTHIALLRILEARPEPAKHYSSALLVQTVHLRVAWIETLKGKVEPAPPSPMDISVEQYEDAGLLILPKPGAWSGVQLVSGAEVVVFCRSASTHPAEILKEPGCELVRPAGEVLPGVRLALGALRRDLNVRDLLAQAKPIAASLGEEFCDFVWERYRDPILRQNADYQAYLAFLQEPALPPPSRNSLLQYVYSAVSGGGLSRDQVYQLAVAMFRLLRLPEAAALHDGLVQVLLPNLLGLQGGAQKSSADDVFRAVPGERSLASRTLQAYRGSADTSSLLAWLQ